MSVDDIQVFIRSVSGSRKTQYLIFILHDTTYFPYFFFMKTTEFISEGET